MMVFIHKHIRGYFYLNLAYSYKHSFSVEKTGEKTQMFHHRTIVTKDDRDLRLWIFEMIKFWGVPENKIFARTPETADEVEKILEDPLYYIPKIKWEKKHAMGGKMIDEICNIDRREVIEIIKKNYGFNVTTGMIRNWQKEELLPQTEKKEYPSGGGYKILYSPNSIKVMGEIMKIKDGKKRRLKYIRKELIKRGVL